MSLKAAKTYRVKLFLTDFPNLSVSECDLLIAICFFHLGADTLIQGIEYGFFFSDPATTELYTLSLHDALPISAATRGRGTGLRLRFNLGEVPELADLPWEYIFDRQHNRFLALSTDTPVVRYLDLPLENPTLEVTPPLKMLAVMASPSDYDPLD